MTDELDGVLAHMDEFRHRDGELHLEDFLAYMPDHRYIFAPTRDLWPASSVDSRLPWPKGAGGKAMKPSKWLDANRPVEQMVWAPGHDSVVNGWFIDSGGWIRRDGVTVFNLYRAPTIRHGDPAQAGPWIAHIRRIYPNEAEHIIRWFAHRVQTPGEKLNHAIVERVIHTP